MSFVKKIYLIVLGIVVGFFSPLLTAQATITAPPKDFYVWQRSQRAVLVSEDKDQNLVLSPQVKGDLKNFLWIIPLPSEPEIKEHSSDPFEGIKTKDIEDFAELFDEPPPSSDKEAFEMAKKIRKWITDGRPK